jgi:hypothetical protein
VTTYQTVNSIRHAIFFIVGSFLFLSVGTFAQKGTEIGLPLIRNYSAKEYGAFEQNWAAIQDSVGIMYFGNGDGLLSYDGTRWNVLELPNRGSVFALSQNREGIIYVGALGELGYLESDKKGQLKYISLLNNLPTEYHDFNVIMSVCSTDEGVFFGSNKYIFKWDGAIFTCWENSGDTFLFAVNNMLFKRLKGKGLTIFNGNDFELVPNGEFIANKKVYSILPINEKKVLIALKNELLTYDGKNFSQFLTSAPDFFTDNTIYTGAILNNGDFAFGSINKGILIIDHKGQEKALLTKKGLLKSNIVLGTFQDRSGIL